MSQIIDYLIVGQGVAGSILALELHHAGCQIRVIDHSKGASSSKVAAGIFNPITGKRLVKTWLCDEIFPHLLEYYQNLESKLGEKILNNHQIIRPIESIKEQNQLIELCAKANHKPFIEYCQENKEASQFENLPKNGFLTTKIGGWVNTPVLLHGIRNFLTQKELIIDQLFDYKQIIFHQNYVEYKSEKFKKIIFCEGYNASNNPYFNWLPFNAVKGEVITIEANLPLKTYTLLKGIFIVPIAENRYKVGATYNWADKTNTITEVAKSEITEKLEKIIGTNYKIIDHLAGIRPATVDRRPFLGLHPDFETLAVFNGLGTKGISLAPYLAGQMVNFLLNNIELHDEININRFSSLYLAAKI